mmetsp:Transcript_25233/g.59068  ORF Transcript_25233/g.59068 Transcript_25233/m.59068 type:complete len:266 (+) Transcript_25233:303-1100(+)
MSQGTQLRKNYSMNLRRSANAFFQAQIVPLGLVVFFVFVSIATSPSTARCCSVKVRHYARLCQGLRDLLGQGHIPEIILRPNLVIGQTALDVQAPISTLSTRRQCSVLILACRRRCLRVDKHYTFHQKAIALQSFCWVYFVGAPQSCRRLIFFHGHDGIIQNGKRIEEIHAVHPFPFFTFKFESVFPRETSHARVSTRKLPFGNNGRSHRQGSIAIETKFDAGFSFCHAYSRVAVRKAPSHELFHELLRECITGNAGVIVRRREL